MIECYYRWCPNHQSIKGDHPEPFCTLNACTAPSGDLLFYQKLRDKEIHNIEILVEVS